MNKKFEALNQYNYLFIDDDLLIKFNKANDRFSKGALKTVIVSAIFGVIIGILILILNEEVMYLFFCISSYLLYLVIGISFLALNKPKAKLLKDQYFNLLKEKDKYQLEILLHNNFKKYTRKWNIIYSIEVLIMIYFSLTLFISDLISTKNTTLAPIFLLYIVGIVLLIPTLLINLKSFKKFRRKQKEIEDKIDSKKLIK